MPATDAQRTRVLPVNNHYSETLKQQEQALEDTTTPRLKKRLVKSLVLLVVLMYFSMGYAMWGWPVGPLEGSNPETIGVIEAVLALIILIINRDFFRSGIKGLLHAAPNMDTLVALGSGVSYLWSLFILITMAIYNKSAMDVEGLSGLGLHDLYFESAAMIVTLITVGKMLEAISRGRTTDALKSLIKLAPETALVEREQTVSEACVTGEQCGGVVSREVEIPLDEIRVGDMVVVRTGMRIPVDAEIIEGKASVDESALTGESKPVAKSVGDVISAATINLNGTIRARATRVGEDTTLAQIIKLVSDTAASKAPIARMADKIAGIFVPAVMVIALVVFAVWMLLGQSLDYALTRAIAVLVISCPCALGLATPVAIMVGSGVGAKHGILFKTAAALEETGRIELVALDKTGTITVGITTSNTETTELSREELLELIEREDAIRPESRAAIEELREMGIKTVMLTGDKKETALAIAEEAGVDDAIYELLPAGKSTAVDELKQQGKTAMVGDGINDAPALTAADVGIAIGAGTDVALDAADIVLVNSSIADLVNAIKLGRKTLRNIKENLFWAFFYNLLLIPLAAGAYTSLFGGWTLSPMLAAAAMSLSSFCVCMNALRLNRAL